MNNPAQATRQIQKRLGQDYPQYRQIWQVSSQRISERVRTDVRWQDGPTENQIEALLSSLVQKFPLSLYLWRRFSVSFLSQVAGAYCAPLNWPVPRVRQYTWDLLGAYVEPCRVSHGDLAQLITKEASRLSQEELNKLAYHWHNGRMVLVTEQESQQSPPKQLPLF